MTPIRRRVATLILLIATVSSQAADLEEGLMAYENSDYASAAEALAEPAASGNATAQFCMGYMHFMGQGLRQNHQLAAQWFERAAKQNLPAAQYNLAWLHITGNGVAQDNSIAINLLRQAAEGDHALAHYELGAFSEYGEGLPQDYKKAASHYQRAADLGLLMANEALTRVGRGIKTPRKANPVKPQPRRDSSLAIINGSSVNLRAQPNLTAEVVARLDQATEVRIMDAQEKWSRVEVQRNDRLHGWIYNSLLSPKLPQP